MRGTLMRRWTREEHVALLTKHTDNRIAAIAYTLDGRGDVSRQNVEYWRKIFIEHEGNMAGTDRELQGQRLIIKPQPDDDIGDDLCLPDGEVDRILFITDLHAPYQHPDTIPFLAAVREQMNPDVVVCGGDELDYHSLSFHDSDPNLDSAGVELEKGKVFLEQLHNMFPDMLVCHSNHGSMAYRRAKAHGIPVQLIKKYRDVMFPDHGAPGWSWAFSWKIDTRLGPVMFKHQAMNVLAEAAHNSCNLIVGHNHGDFKIEYSASSAHLYYGCTGGCLIDKDALAFAYGKHAVRKPVIGVVMILRGRPVLVPMQLDSNGRWNGGV